jgi:hypothetical protein
MLSAQRATLFLVTFVEKHKGHALVSSCFLYLPGFIPVSLLPPDFIHSKLVETR